LLFLCNNISSWDSPEPYELDFDTVKFGGEVLKGRYNEGYVVEGVDITVGGNVVDSPEEYVLWSPMDESTPEMSTQEDLMTYHLARARNADVMRDQGLTVPETSIAEVEKGSGSMSFLVTPYIDHDSFEQRPKFPGGDMRRNNPHMQDPYDSPARRNFKSKIEKAMSEIDDEYLVKSGKIVNAGENGIDDHNKNWGLFDDGLVRLDIGEVPADGPIWDGMPYSGPEEFYSEEGLREEARTLMEDMSVEPEERIPEELDNLMNFS
jgi:hypothetical protein